MNISPLVRNLGILAVISVLILVLNQQTSLITAALLLQVAFFIALALVAYMVWRDFGRREIELWPRQRQWVFYGAVALLVVDLGWFFIERSIFSGGGMTGPELLVFFLVAAACVYAGVRTWRESHRYS